MNEDGFEVFDPTPDAVAWARAARAAASRCVADPQVRRTQLRHGQTWFVGVDVLDNAADGTVAGVPLRGPWTDAVPRRALHRAQVSVVFPGYPGRDKGEAAGAHRYRAIRGAAHVDGLLPVGAARRRYAQEYHAYILGLPLNACAQAPTLVWRGSHHIMGAALRDAIGAAPVGAVDVTEAYHAARRTVFARCACVEMQVPPGGAFLLHRHLLHGTAPWQGAVGPGRMVAFFRPELTSAAAWLAPD